jgi:hypothetical protein
MLSTNQQYRGNKYIINGKYLTIKDYTTKIIHINGKDVVIASKMSMYCHPLCNKMAL